MKIDSIIQLGIRSDYKVKISIAGSNIYPILKNMEDIGLIKSEKDDKTLKRIYSLTEDGKEYLKLLKELLTDFINITQNIMDTNI